MAIIFEVKDLETGEMHAIKQVSIDDKTGVMIYTNSCRDVESITEIFDFYARTSYERNEEFTCNVLPSNIISLQGIGIYMLLGVIANSHSPFMSETLTTKINEFVDKPKESIQPSEETVEESVKSPNKVGESLTP